MEKQIYNLCSVFLTMNRFVLFLLITVPLALKFSSSGSDSLGIFNTVLSVVGWTCLLAWLFAIGHKANEKLVAQGIHLDAFRFFNWAVIIAVVLYMLGLLFSDDLHTMYNEWKVSYVTPIWIPISFAIAYLCTILIAAKTLVSAELDREAKFANYFITMLLILFFFIGVWFIQPRVQKLLERT